MKKKSIINKLIILTCLLFVIACDDDILDSVNRSGNAFYFSSSTENWGQETRNGVSMTRGGANTPKTEIIPVKGESNIKLLAIYNDNFGSIKTLHTSEDNATRAVLQDKVPTDVASPAFTLAAYYDENGVEQTLIDKQTVIYDHHDNTLNKDFWKLSGEDKAYWKFGSQAISTFAWWPQTLTFDASTKKFSYEVPDDIVNQQDFLYAYVPPTYYTVNESADVTFNHALTAVHFALGNALEHPNGQDEGKVTKITLTNLFYKGTFDPITQEWAIDKSARKDFVLNITNPVGMRNGQTNVVINPNEYTLLMLPQNLGESNCEGIFEMEDGRVFRATLNHGGTWEPGQTVTYQLSGDISVGYVIYASAHEATYTGSGANISVTSYQLQGATPHAQKWKVTGFSIDNGTYWNDPSATTWRNQAGTTTMTPWITTRNLTGINTSDATAAATVSLTVSASPQTSASGIGEDINNALYNTSFNNYDLSTYNAATKETVSRSSANCYMVRGYGTFRFPAAYGSALKNGSDNTSAYSPTNFVNYKGNHITKPYIQDDTGVTPPSTGAKVIWAEQPIASAITNLSYNSSSKEISFTVPRNQVYQGNAVVGLFDSNNVCMWSWHLWFTTDKTTYPTTAITSSYKFAPDNIGTIHTGRKSVYGMRQVMLKIEQIDDAGEVIKGSSMCTIYVSQTSGEEDNRALCCVYYQWGRKDPKPIGWNNVRPSNNNRNYTYPSGWSSSNTSTVTAVLNIGGYDWNQTGAQITMRDAIRHPNVVKVRRETLPSLDWCSTRYDNWWNANISTESGTVAYANTITTFTKTVYDPCPVGYHVPPAKAFESITHDKETEFGSLTGTNGNAILYRTFTVNSNKITFYLLGYYWRPPGMSGVSDFNNNTFAWSSSAYTVHGAWSFYTHLTTTNPGTSGPDRCDEIAIRPVAD